MAYLSLSELKKELRAAADPVQAKNLQRFFKTGPGEYGEGDVFLGLTVPETRGIAGKYRHLPPEDAVSLLHSRIHEERFAALLLLTGHFKRGDAEMRARVYKMYLENTRWINNWDLVDVSAHKIVGAYLLDRPRGILRKLARSGMLWERRIAVISTFAFIYNGETADTYALAGLLLEDPHDLMHKAVGWMLREAGKRVSLEEEQAFLDKHAPAMPRTMLRYAIEKLPERRRKYYLSRKS